MFCTECGNKLSEGVKFCPGCGAKLQIGEAVPEPVKVEEILWNHLRTLYESGIKPDFDGFSNQKYTIKDRDDFYGFAIIIPINLRS